MKRPFYTTLLVAIVASFIIVHAETTAPGIIFSPAIGICYNPLGLLIDTKLLHTSPLVKKVGLLWESTKTRIGVQNEWTPADNLLSVRFECEPIAFFDVTVKAGFFSMFDALGYGCFRMADGAAGEYNLKTQDREGRGSAGGYWISVTPTVKAKIGRIIALNTLAVNRISIDGPGRFLELHSYLPHKTIDVDLVNNTIALYECSQKILAGMSFKNTYVYGTSRFSQQISGMAIFKTAPIARLPRFLLLNAGMYLKDPLFTNKIYLAFLAGADIKVRRLF